MDIDDDMSGEKVEAYLKNLIHEYTILLVEQVNKIKAEGATVTFRKLRKIKKQVLFKLLKKVKNKNE